MGIAWILSAAVGLSADAFTVAVCKGIGMKRCNVRYALAVAAFFGGFQALMPVAGWLLGSALSIYISSVDHWIAFFLLTFIGAKMIRGAHVGGSEVVISSSPDYAELFGLAVATSIDALAVGVTFAFLKVNIFTAAALIGTVTFALSFLGVAAGARFGSRFDEKLPAAGGCVLIALGIKILLSGLFAA